MDIKHVREIPTGSPPAGALNRGGISTNKTLYLANDTSAIVTIEGE